MITSKSHIASSLRHVLIRARRSESAVRRDTCRRASSYFSSCSLATQNQMFPTSTVRSNLSSASIIQISSRVPHLRWKSEESNSTKKPAEDEPVVVTTGSKPHSAIAAQLEERLKRVVSDLNLSDQLSVIGIVVLTAIILTAPFVIREMKKSGREDYSVTSEDPVDDLTMVVRRAWDGDEEDESSRKSAVEIMLKDILKSQGLQQAAQDFFIRILEAPEFQAALQRLAKTLWTDLISDKETIAQVIRLLQIAIQDPAVKKSAQLLVLQLVQDPEVKESLIDLIQSLGAEKAVLDVTQALITEAAHNALNDTEILDHSMEFATDVVGDDVVQRTAGEALRKSVGHAFRPASTVLLTAAGIGLMVFGVATIGYARSSDQEIVLLETAARSLQSNASYGIMRIVTWPLRAVQAFWIDTEILLWKPVYWLHDGSALVVARALSFATESIDYVLRLPNRGCSAVIRGMSLAGQSAVAAVVTFADESARMVTSLVSSYKDELVAAVAHILMTAIDFIMELARSNGHAAITSATFVFQRGKEALQVADRVVIDFYARLLMFLENILTQIRSSIHVH